MSLSILTLYAVVCFPNKVKPLAPTCAAMWAGPVSFAITKELSFIIANDTGPAHIAAHVGAKGLTLFGKHTTAYKVSIERDNFKAIEVTDLNNLSAEKVFERLIGFDL